MLQIARHVNHSNAVWIPTHIKHRRRTARFEVRCITSTLNFQYSRGYPSLSKRCCPHGTHTQCHTHRVYIYIYVGICLSLNSSVLQPTIVHCDPSSTHTCWHCLCLTVQCSYSSSPPHRSRPFSASSPKWVADHHHWTP